MGDVRTTKINLPVKRANENLFTPKMFKKKQNLNKKNHGNLDESESIFI